MKFWLRHWTTDRKRVKSSTKDVQNSGTDATPRMSTLPCYYHRQLNKLSLLIIDVNHKAISCPYAYITESKE